MQEVDSDNRQVESFIVLSIFYAVQLHNIAFCLQHCAKNAEFGNKIREIEKARTE